LSEERTRERHSFQAEARQVLDLMVHAVYSNKDVFLREIVSNASDALDKLRLESLTNDALRDAMTDPGIWVERNAEERTLSVSDNGIGMTKDEMVLFLGTIAKSGTKEFLRVLKETGRGSDPEALIGQFGVGFYAAFMVSDRVSVTSRKAGTDEAWKWESEGDGGYFLEPAERSGFGTTVTLHLRPADEEDGLKDYTDEWVLKEIVRRYSDFVAYPIRMGTETLNSMKAIWARPKNEVKDSDFEEFYRHVSHDWNPPLKRIAWKAEGSVTFDALLFIPSKAPLDLFIRDVDRGLQLYVKRVFIKGDCRELLPDYLRFVRGVVDSEDLSLNMSREILQQSRQMEMIRTGLTRRILSTLDDMRTGDPAAYRTFWKEFGRVLKEGLFLDEKNREKLLELCLFKSSISGEEWVTLDEVSARLPEGRKEIFYLLGEDRSVLEQSPLLEAFRSRGIEVLFMTDPVDEIWLQAVDGFKDFGLKDAGKGDLDLAGTDEKEKSKEKRDRDESRLKPLMDYLKEKLSSSVREVRLSGRLTGSPACLVLDERDPSPQFAKVLASLGREAPQAKRILELNPEHAVVRGMAELLEKAPADPGLEAYADLLYGTAALSEGNLPDDAPGLSRRLSALLEERMGSKRGPLTGVLPE